ncbi:MAG: efflux RND transporter permease subunit [Myxococcales bacterium]|nr:efflux RND transporter permease subunit [Myxococcales bacterium]
MHWLAAICIKRPVFATVLILALCVVGAVAYGRLGVDRFPKVDFPVVTITTRLPGAAPTEVETQITDKIEEAVNTISGIDELRSSSSEGVSQVFVTFVLEKDPDVAAQEVRDKISGVVPRLPKDIELPTVTRIDPDATPVVTITLAAPKPVREVSEVADRFVRRRLEGTTGVGQVLLVGGRKRQVNIWLDPIAPRRRPHRRRRAARARHPERADPWRFHRDRAEDAHPAHPGPRRERHRARRHRAQAGGQHAGPRVRRRAGRGRRSRARRPSPGRTASRRSCSRPEAVGQEHGRRGRRIRRAPRRDPKHLPPGYHARVVRDLSTFIEAAIANVEEHLILGSILAALVVLLFLGSVRRTIIAAMAIPTSIIGTFGLIWVYGFTLNSITLLALALAVGIVIDDAIVVLENIYRLIEEKNLTPAKAADHGTKEIGLAVLATTLSLIAMFVPVAFMGGIVGRFMKSFGLTMAFAIIVSLVVSFTLTPMLSARCSREDPRPGQQTPKSSRCHAVDAFYRAHRARLHGHPRVVMRQRWVVVLASLRALLALHARGCPRLPPRNDQSQFEVNLRAPEGTSLDATQLISERIAA